MAVSPGAFAGAALLALMAGPALAEDGWAAYDARRYEDAVRLWRAAAASGDALAEFGLGIAYDLGQGVTADSLEACRWYGRAGAAGVAASAFNTGILYDAGRCGPRRADLAALWYARAAAAGHGRAQFNIGQMYAGGDGVPRNPDLAAAWFRAAAAHGVPAAADRGRAPRAGAPSDATPAAAVPEETPTVRPGEGGAAVLVWTAPAQPGPVKFFVEVEARRWGGFEEVVGRYVDESAVVVQLPPADGYAWRVLTVSTERPHYAAGPWQALGQAPGPELPPGR